MQKTSFIKQYYSILSPDYPSFIDKYLNLPILKRLNGVGLLCGTDWTPLYNNSFFYSRLDHSIGVALIIWNFTHDKAQTLSGLLHDVSTPAFSHVLDFMKGDTLRQETTESLNAHIILTDNDLKEMLKTDEISLLDVSDYHRYPIADNDLPGLSADRLEYMYSTGFVMRDIWTLHDIRESYNNMKIFKNEIGNDELGFTSLDIASDYCCKCCLTSKILLENENKLTLKLLSVIISKAIEIGAIKENDCYLYSEEEMMDIFSHIKDEEFKQLFQTFRFMTKIIRSKFPLSNMFSVSLDVKRRYINPLVGSVRASELSDVTQRAIEDLLSYTDSLYANVLFYSCYNN